MKPPTDCRAERVPAARRGGFTLFELLVVLVIVALGLGATLVALGPDAETRARTEADRLALLLGLASEESVAGGAVLAWVGREDGYEFQARQLTDGGPDWTIVRGDELLHPRQLPDGVRIRGVQVDGGDLPLGQRVELGSRVGHELSILLGREDALVRVSGSEGRFQATADSGGVW